MSRENHIQDVVEGIHATKRAICARMSKVSGTAITPSQWAMLQVLYYNKKMSIKDLATALSVTGSAVTQTVNELESKGCLKRSPDPSDRRSIIVSPTSKCIKMMSKMEKEINESCSELFSKLTDSELKTFAKLYRKIS